jgi:hypothetical protein
MHSATHNPQINQTFPKMYTKLSQCVPNLHIDRQAMLPVFIEKTINCQKKIATKILDHRELAKEETQQRAKV